MNEIFISYSRRNADFTQKLFKALEAANRSTWADWDDIPAASDWSEEIKEGIEKAESVLFVLSPEWIKSNECHKELTHALKAGKRLIPIVCQMIDPKDIPPELAKINWVYMRESDEFAAAFQTLCAAMDTDLEWVKSHTRIQVRALEWDKHGRENSFALRGKDLADAEQVMSQSTGKSPEPTALQQEYILASRKDATRRQRLTLIGVVIALVVSTALGVMAFFQRQVAVAERDRADLNAKMAFTRELASSALVNLEVDPERSLLLALQAVDITKGAGQPIQIEVEGALRRAVQTSRVRQTISGHTDAIWGVAFSPNGQLLATASADGTVKVWEVSDQTTGSFSSQPLLTLSDFTSGVTSVAFSPDGTRLLTASYDNTAIIWNMENGNQLITLTGHTQGINKAIFSPDGTRIITASADNTAKIWDTNTGQLEFDLRGHTAEVYSIAISPDGSQIATASDDGTIIIWNAESGEQLLTLGEGCSMRDVAFSLDGNSIASGDNCLQSVIWDLASGEVISKNLDHTDIVSAVSFSPDGATMASAGRDDIVLVINKQTNLPDYTLIDTSDIYAMAFSSDGKYIATGNADGKLKLWDANPINGYEIMGFQPHYYRIDGMEFSPDGTHYVTSSWDGTAFIWSLTGEAPIELIGHQDMVRDVAYSPDGNKVITGGYDGMAIIWDAATGAKLQTLSGNSQNVMAVNFSPDGKLAVGGLENDVVLIWDATTGEELRSLQSDEQYFITEVAFSPDGETLAIASDTHMTTLWDVATWMQKLTLIGHTDWVKGVAFSPDGKRLVTGSYDTTAIVWDAATGESLFSMSGHAQGINDVTFSPDGALIATASVDRSAKLWDANTGALIATLPASSDKISSVAFSRDGNILASGSETGVIRFYYTHFESVLSLAKKRITRSLTEKECGIYLHEEKCPETQGQLP